MPGEDATVGPCVSGRPWRQERGAQLFFNMAGAWPRLMTVEPATPPMRLLQGGFVTARTWQEAGAESAKPTISGAVYGPHGRLLPEFAARVALSQTVPMPFADPPHLGVARRAAATELAGEHMYGGELSGHFGHCLLETMARAWAFRRQPPGASVLFHRAGKGSGYGPVTRQLLAWAGVPLDAIVSIDRDLRVERLRVPASRFEIEHRVSPDFPDLFQSIKQRMLRRSPERARPCRLYLSRRHLDQAKRAALAADTVPERKRARSLRKLIENEEEAEALFQQRGFTVISPEQVPLVEQVALWDAAEVVAGITGSALHGALFGRPGVTRTISLNNRLSRNQVAIEEVMRLPAAHIFCTARDQPDGPAALRPAIIARALDELGL